MGEGTVENVSEFQSQINPMSSVMTVYHNDNFIMILVSLVTPYQIDYKKCPTHSLNVADLKVTIDSTPCYHSYKCYFCSYLHVNMYGGHSLRLRLSVRIVVHLFFSCECLGFKVSWDPCSRGVEIELEN